MTNLVIGQAKGTQGNEIVHFSSQAPLFPTINPNDLFDAEMPFLVDADEWFIINGFSKQMFLPGFLRQDHCLGDFPHASRRQFHSLNWLASFQSNGIYFQRVVPNLYRDSKIVEFEERATLRYNNSRLKIHDRPDAVYFRSNDLLAFRNPRALLPIFGTSIPFLHRQQDSHFQTLMSSNLFEIHECLKKIRISDLNSIHLHYVSDFLKSIKFSQRAFIVDCLIRKDSDLITNRSGARIVINELETLRKILCILEEDLYRPDDYLGRSIYGNYVERSVVSNENYTLLSA